MPATDVKTVTARVRGGRQRLLEAACRGISWGSRRAGTLPPATDDLFETRIWWGHLRGHYFAMPSLVRPSMALGAYERFMTREIHRYVRPGDTVYDIGASFGYHSLCFAACVESHGRVVAFEPGDTDRAVLERNVAQNALSQVEVRAEAVGAKSGTARFATYGFSLVNHIDTGEGGRTAADAQVVEVPLVSLDDFVFAHGQRPPSFVKIIVVTGEAEIIEGAARLLDEVGPVVIVESAYGAPFARIENVVSPLGYRAIRLLGSPYSEWRSKFLLLPPE